LVCLRLASSSSALRARLLPKWFSPLAAAIVHLHIIRGMAAITVILATRTTTTTLATTAMAGEATIDLGGGIGTTADIMAGGTGTGGVADAAGVAADGTAIINSESRLGCSGFSRSPLGS
jgi:hypothetical protein